MTEVKEIRTREVLDLLNDSLGDLVFNKNKEGKVDRSCKLYNESCKFPNEGTLSLKNSFRGGAFIGCSNCLLYTSPSPRDRQKSRMPSSA